MENKNTDAANASKNKDGLDAALNSLNEGDKGDANQEKNPYEVALAQAKADLEFANTKLAQKNGALKEKNDKIAQLKSQIDGKPATEQIVKEETVTINGITYPKAQVEAIKEIVKSENSILWDTMNKKQQDDYLKNLIPNKSERELVQFHLDNTLKGGTGDLEKDIANARLLANANIRKEDEDNDDFLANITAGSGSAPKSNNRFTGNAEEQANKRTAAGMLANMGYTPEQIKQTLDKQ